MLITLSVSAQKTTLMADTKLKAITAEASGSLIKDHIVALSLHHRVQASAGFHDAARYIADKAREYGLQEVAIESFPADGKTTYNSFRSYLGWEAQAGVLTEISPRREIIADYGKLRVALADYSNAADVTTELIDVGVGTSDNDYAGKEVKGKIVLAGGNVAKVHQLAVEARGAAGILSYQQNQVTGWSGDYQDNVRWGHLSPYNINNTFAFMISLRQARSYRSRLSAGEKIQLQARVTARTNPGEFIVVTGIIPGSDASAGEIVYSCHLCHQKPGANDNASGAATILEDARLLTALINSGRLPRPRRTIRFIWPPEIAGTMCYFSRHPDIVKKMRAAIHMDMVGGNYQITKSILHITRTPASLPSYVNDVAAVFSEYVLEGSRRAALNGDFSDANQAYEGNKEVLIAEPAAFTMGSDHEVYQEGSFRIPTVYMNDWPDVFIHTNNDLPDNMDVTKLQRVAVIGGATGYFLASATPQEARTLAQEVFTRGGIRQNVALQRAMALARKEGASAADILSARNIVRLAAWQEREALAAIEQLSDDRDLKRLIDDLIKQVKERESQDEAVLTAINRAVAAPIQDDPLSRLVPKRKVIGNMNVYYYDFLEDHGIKPAEAVNLDGLISYEALNFVDGKRSLREISDMVKAAYGQGSPEELHRYFKLLERIGVIAF